MRSFRSKPVGWMNDSYRHSLAARGIRSYNAVKFKFVDGPPAERIRLNFKFVDNPPENIPVKILTGDKAGTAKVRIQIGDVPSEPVMKPSSLPRFQPITPETADPEKVRVALKDLPARDRGRVYDKSHIRRLVGKVKDAVRIEDFRPDSSFKQRVDEEFLPEDTDESKKIKLPMKHRLSKSEKAIQILEKKGQLTRGSDGAWDEESLERVRVLRAADDPLAGTDEKQVWEQIKVIMSKLEDRPKIERRPYAMVLGEPVSRIDTSDVTGGEKWKHKEVEPFETIVSVQDPALEWGKKALKKQKPEDTSFSEWKERVKAENEFYDRQEAFKKLQKV